MFLKCDFAFWSMIVLKGHDVMNIYEIIGKIIFHCQVIESDLKVIYSCLVSNDKIELVSNFDELSNATIGELLKLLGDKKLLEKNDLDILHQLRKIRNYVVHQACLEYAFESGVSKEVKKKGTMDKLNTYEIQLKDAMFRLEKLRLRLVETYK